MDSVMTIIQHLPLSKANLTYIIVLLAGALIPIIVGMILPRKQTIAYGSLIYKFLGALLIQKRIHPLAGSILGGLLTTIRSTFVDLSFGVYIASRKDLTAEEKAQKIEEYLKLTIEAVQTNPPPAPTQPTPPTNQ